MTSRREFLQIGITASAWPLASNVSAAARGDLSGSAPLPIYKAIYDRRFAESRLFAERARGVGLDVEPIDGDMTRFWYRDLCHEWQRHPIAIAGQTAHGPMFCFEQLGRDCRMRIVFRAEHRLGDDGGLRHTLTGPVELLEQAEGATAQLKLDSWSQCMGQLVAACRSGRAEIATTAFETAPGSVSGSFSRDPNVEALYTWVLAPAIRA
jgi:hypothetical protein